MNDGELCADGGGAEVKQALAQAACSVVAVQCRALLPAAAIFVQTRDVFRFPILPWLDDDPLVNMRD